MLARDSRRPKYLPKRQYGVNHDETKKGWLADFMVTKNVGLLYYLLPENTNPKSVLYRNISGLEDLDNIGEDF